MNLPSNDDGKIQNADKMQKEKKPMEDDAVVGNDTGSSVIIFLRINTNHRDYLVSK